MAMSKHRRAGAAALMLASIVLGVVLMSWRRPDNTKTHLDRVNIGMSRADVEKVLGEGNEIRMGSGSATGRTIVEEPRRMFVWYAPDWSTARIWFAEDRVVKVEWHDSTE